MIRATSAETKLVLVLPSRKNQLKQIRMIPLAAITEWTNTVPWIDMKQVEQDLIISRALVAIYSDEFLSSRLAFRGGTALHKLYLSPQPRYSEDIDMVQINFEPAGAIIDRLREVLSFLDRPVIKQWFSKLIRLKFL